MLHLEGIFLTLKDRLLRSLVNDGRRKLFYVLHLFFGLSFPNLTSTQILACYLLASRDEKVSITRVFSVYEGVAL